MKEHKLIELLMRGGWPVLIIAAFLWLRDRIWFYPAVVVSVVGLIIWFYVK